MAYISVRNASEVTPALLFSHCQWNDLYKITTKAKDLEAEAKQKLVEMEKRKELSQQMASTWENTYINIRKQRYEKRKERMLKEQKYKEKVYEKLRIESEKVKKQVCENAKEAFFFNRDACKSLHSAYRTSEVEAERLAQLDFNEKLRKIDREIETKYAESIMNDVQRYHEEQEEEKRFSEEKKKQLKIEAKTMFDEAEARKRAERERQHKEEKEDMEIMQRQLEQVLENERKEILRKKQLAKQSLLENREEIRAFKEMLREEEEEENKALEIIANGKITMARIRKQKEEQMLNANRARYQTMATKLSNDAEEREKKEEESLRRADEEKYKIEVDRKEKEKQYREMLKKERIDEYLKHMKEQDERLAVERELLKWEILKRFQREEINNKYTDKLKEQRKKRAEVCRKSYINQVKTEIDKKMKDKQIDLEACQRAQELYELEDKEFLEYAMKVREESKKKGRCLYPIDTAIYNYKKNHGLIYQDRNFIWNAKIRRPTGIEEKNFDSKGESQMEKLQNCLRVQTIPREDCGCPKRANGM